VKLPNGVDVSPLIEPLLVTDAFFVGLERWNDLRFAHCQVFAPWSMRLRRELRAAWDDVVREHAPIFAASNDPHGGDMVKFGKFCRQMGWRDFRRVRGIDGTDYDVFVRWG